ncbi:hypothetical protein EUGRSUZ_C00005 [Eucalyptus grandis]|uniref:Uncharacterized protein n=2 Tax=Eucalyptus grandis TaxID=71139 RepID=A0ACC3L9W9_EUCGR|nr:hypothetical protein EUGRSUZ_C00005 [Eucalyptus grandis]
MACIDGSREISTLICVTEHATIRSKCIIKGTQNRLWLLKLATKTSRWPNLSLPKNLGEKKGYPFAMKVAKIGPQKTLH